MRGMLGGFFEELGLKGVLVMLSAGAGVSFMHSYASAKIKKYLKENHPAMTDEELIYNSELYTGGLMLTPAVTWMILRLTDKLPSSDSYDVLDNVFGADFLWESWNAVETMIGKLEQ